MRAQLQAIDEGRSRKQGGKGRGRPTNAAAEKRAKVSAALKLVCDGFLPGETAPPKQKTREELAASAQKHSADHAPKPKSVAAAASGLFLVSQKAPDADGSDTDDSDHDEPDAVDDLEGKSSSPSEQSAGALAPSESTSGAAPVPPARKARKSPGKVPLSAQQQRQIDKPVDEVKAGTADRFRFAPPDPTMVRGAFTTAAFTMLGVIVWLPHLLWRHLKIPPQPPCPKHGFDCVVKQHGTKVVRPRRYVGVNLHDCGWLVGSCHKCMTCMAERAAAKSQGLPFKHLHYIIFAATTRDPSPSMPWWKSGNS